MAYRTAAEWRAMSLQYLADRRSERGESEWEHAVAVLIEAHDWAEVTGEAEWDRRLAVAVAVAQHVVDCRECHERHPDGWTPAERLLTRSELAPFAMPILAELGGYDGRRIGVRELVRRARG